jgi:hypothetical protein
MSAFSLRLKFQSLSGMQTQSHLTDAFCLAKLKLMKRFAETMLCLRSLSKFQTQFLTMKNNSLQRVFVFDEGSFYEQDRTDRAHCQTSRHF